MLQPVTTSPVGGLERGADLEAREPRAGAEPGVRRRGDERRVVIRAGRGGLEHDRLPFSLVAAVVSGAALGAAAPLVGAAALSFGVAAVDHPPVRAASPIARRAAFARDAPIGRPLLVRSCQ